MRSRLYKQGWKIADIAKELNEDNVPIPSVYKKLTGCPGIGIEHFIIFGQTTLFEAFCLMKGIQVK